MTFNMFTGKERYLFVEVRKNKVMSPFKLEKIAIIFVLLVRN